MLVIPAVDLKGGRCVRLRQGDFAAETVYAADPVAVARRWADLGAPLLHVVDLDAAVAGEPVHGAMIARICDAVPIPVQVGGGVRSVEQAARLFAHGAARVIFGTAAAEAPEVVREAARRFPGRVLVAIDARDGWVAVRGWRAATRHRAVEVARDAAGSGAAALVYTDITRDGTEAGPNVPAIRALAEAVDVPVIASGGVGSVADIAALRALAPVGVAGVIVGRALYTGAVALPEALRVAGGGRA